jgi:hypothetical protein
MCVTFSMETGQTDIRTPGRIFRSDQAAISKFHHQRSSVESLLCTDGIVYPGCVNYRAEGLFEDTKRSGLSHRASESLA